MDPLRRATVYCCSWFFLFPLVARSEIKVLRRNYSMQTQFGGISAPGFVDLSGITLSASTPDRWSNYKNDTVPIDIAILRSAFCYPGSVGSRRCESWPERGLCRQDYAIKCCCSSTDIFHGVCPKEGGLIVDRDSFDGLLISTSVPVGKSIDLRDVLNKAETQMNVTASRTYAVYFSNCHHLLQASGEIVWKSEHGYLYGNTYLAMFIYALLMAAYMVLFIFFSRALSAARRRQQLLRYEIARDHRAILGLLVMGTLHMFLSTWLYADWNHTGHYSYTLSTLGIWAGGIKDGFLFPLILLVALEEQVATTAAGSRNSSSNRRGFLLMAALWIGTFRQQRTIVALGFAYIVSSVTAQILYAYYDAHYDELSDSERNLLELSYPLLGILAALVMITFFCRVLRLHRASSLLSRAFRRGRRGTTTNNNGGGDHDYERAFDRSVQLLNTLRFSVALSGLCFAAAVLLDVAKVEDELRDGLCLIIASLQFNFCNLTAAVAFHRWPGSGHDRTSVSRLEDDDVGGIDEVEQRQREGDVELVDSDNCPVDMIDPLVERNSDQ